jgi:hypothetical protein
MRAGQSWPEGAPALAQCRACDSRMVGDAHKCRQLAGLAANRSENGNDIRFAVLTQPDFSGGRQPLIDRVNDDTTRGKWNAVLGRDARSNMGFHVRNDRARAGMQCPLLRRMNEQRITARNIGVHGPRERGQKASHPGRVGCKIRLASPHTRGNNQIAGNEIPGKSPRHSKADDARGAAADRLSQRRNEV